MLLLSCVLALDLVDRFRAWCREHLSSAPLYVGLGLLVTTAAATLVDHLPDRFSTARPLHYVAIAGLVTVAGVAAWLSQFADDTDDRALSRQVAAIYWLTVLVVAACGLLLVGLDFQRTVRWEVVNHWVRLGVWILPAAVVSVVAARRLGLTAPLAKPLEDPDIWEDTQR